MVVSNSFQVDPERGAIRFWYRPDYGSEAGPGKVATLATLVSAKGGNEATWWSLVVTPDGKEIHLLCQTGGGAESCMKAEINWIAGGWHLVTLGFTPTNSAIFIDDLRVANGTGLQSVPEEAWPFTSLVLGSTLSGADSASGQMEELSTFSGRNKFLLLMGLEFGMIESWDIAGYYSGWIRMAALGPISATEEAALAKRRAEMKAQREAAGEDGGAAMMRFASSGPSAVCITNGPVFMTNVVSYFSTNDGWTFGFDLLGGTSGVPVDLYCATNLLGSHITNSFWSFVDSNLFNCTSYTFTNQDPARSFFVLGKTNDADSDSLSDAFELLVSKSLVSTNDTDADGMPDGWEVHNGLDPLVNDAGDDPDGDWLTNIQEYNGGTNSTNPHDVMVVTWGQNIYGQLNVPEGLRNAVAVTGGQKHSLALRSDGSVMGWGGGALGETNVPSGLSNAVALASNGHDSTSSPGPAAINLALKNDGTVTQWGTISQTVPSNLSNVTAVAAGAFHALALRNDGSVVVWGETNIPAAQLPAGLTGVRSIAAGFHHTAAVLSNGTVAAWGINYPTLGYTMTNIPPGLSNVSAVSAKALHTLALRNNGTVVAWGYDQSGQTNVPAGLSNVIAVAAGAGHSMALKQDGTVSVWGSIGPLNGLDQVSAIGAGYDHCLAVRSGRLLPFIILQPIGRPELPGDNITYTAQGLGLAGVKYQWQFNGVNITGQTNATLNLTNISTNNAGNYTVVISTGAGSVTSSVAPLTLIGPPVITNTIPTAPSTNYLTNDISAPVDLRVEATALGTDRYPIRYQWFTNGVAIASATNSSYSQLLTWVPLWQTNAMDGDYTVKVWNPVGTNQAGAWTVRVISLPKEGSTVAWGNNSDGQVEYPPDLTNTLSIAGGDFHSVTVREDGGVVQWGHSWAGIPANLTNAVAVAAGSQHTVALRNGGTVLCWGTNTLGQTNTPADLTNVIAVAAGGNQSMALRKDGSVTNWGQVFAAKPASATNVVAIACGTNFNLALKSNATVVAWGQNNFGQTNVPSGLSNVVAVAAGGSHALALKVDGTVVAWGLNANGQTNVPAGLSNVMAVAAGWKHSAALKNDGSVVCWGDNGNGQTNVPGILSNVKLIAAGGNHTLAGVFSQLVQFPVDVTKDLLLIYNTTSTNSISVKDYYLAHRPMISGANVLGIAGPTNDIYLPAEFTNHCATAVGTWLNQNPTKRPQYVILFSDIPERVNTNTPVGTLTGARPSVSYSLHTSWTGWRPFVMHIHMGDTNTVKAYIDKLEFIGTNYSPGKLFISASAGGYGNTNYYFDDAGTPSFFCTNGVTGVLANGANTSAVHFASGNYSQHIFSGTNVAGYSSWGQHAGLGGFYPTNGTINFTGNSGWYLIETVESNNGQRHQTDQGNFVRWFAVNAFGGTNYSNTPVGATTTVDEPGIQGVADPQKYFGLWEAKKCFGICLWNSRRSPYIQGIGDPFVTK